MDWNFLKKAFVDFQVDKKFKAWLFLNRLQELIIFLATFLFYFTLYSKTEDISQENVKPLSQILSWSIQSRNTIEIWLYHSLNNGNITVTIKLSPELFLTSFNRDLAFVSVLLPIIVVGTLFSEVIFNTEICHLKKKNKQKFVKVVVFPNS